MLHRMIVIELEDQAHHTSILRWIPPIPVQIQVDPVLCRVDPIQYRNQQSVIRMFALFPSMIPVRIPEDLIQSQEAQILPNNVQ